MFTIDTNAGVMSSSPPLFSSCVAFAPLGKTSPRETEVEKLFMFVASSSDCPFTFQSPTSTRSFVKPVNGTFGVNKNVLIVGRACARSVAACLMSGGVGSFHGTIPWLIQADSTN